MNIKLKSNNTTGYKGVNYMKRQKRFCARIGINGVRITIGYFKEAKDASKAYEEASIKIHGKFSNLG